MKTTTLKEIDEITGGNIRPDMYYKWGNEPIGFVSCGLYLNDVWQNCGFIPESEVVKYGLTYHCPYN